MDEASQLKKILAKLDIGGIHPMLTPVPQNIKHEKAKFIKNNSYSPEFIYGPTKLDLDKIKELEAVQKEVDEIGFTASIAEYVERIVLHTFDMVNLIGSRGNDAKFASQLRKIYDWDLGMDSSVVSTLYESAIIEDSTDQYNAIHIRERMRSLLNDYGLHDWKVDIINIDRDIVAVSPSNKKISIGARSVRTELGIQKLIAHEIDCHVLRSVNAHKQNLGIVINGKLPGKILCEEGFAVFSEYKQNVIKKEDVDKYLMRFELSKLEGLGFTELTEICVNKYHLSIDKAFDAAYRLKRGFCDTGSGEIHPKDSAYLKGFELMYKKMKDKEDYKLMLSGKVSFNESILVDLGILDTDNLLMPNWISDLGD